MNKIEFSVRDEIRNMKAYVGGEVSEIGVKLNQNESPFNLPEEIIEKVKKRMDTIKFNRYNEGSLRKLRELTARKFNVDADQIIYGCGMDELFYYLTLVFVSNGDKLVRPVPSFGMYDICAKVSGARDVPIALDEKFEITDEFAKESKDAKLTFICRPNSQTGNLWNKKIIEKIVKETSGIVCIDEAYAEFAEEDCLDLLKYENVVIMRTFSKCYLAAGLRLGYAIGSKKTIEYMNRVRLPWNVNVLSQVIGEIILENEDVFKEKLEEIKENRKELITEMEKIVKILPTETNFISFEVQKPREVFEKLKEKGVLIRDICKYPMLEKYLRVNVGTKEENEKFLSALKDVLQINQDAVIFDIDGVLVDVSKSYREAIKRTVEKFRGTRATDQEIELIKRKPNSNNDWVVTYALATRYEGDLSKINRSDKNYLKMKEVFQNFYLNELIDNEKILINKKYIYGLKKKGTLIGVVTSRPRYEALYVLKRINLVDENFVVAQEDCDEEKPSPKPILTLLQKMGTKNAIYVGDTINDQLAAEKANIRYENVDEKQDVNEIIKRLLI